jgi:hypothetical protein
LSIDAHPIDIYNFGCVKAYFDIRSITLFRIALGLVAIGEIVFNKVIHFDAFYSINGITNPESIQLYYESIGSSIYSWSILHSIQSDLFAIVIFSITLLSLFLYALGYFSKIFGVIALILLASIHIRNPLILSGPDEFLISLLFFSLLLPLHGRMSWSKPHLKLKTDEQYAAFQVKGLHVGIIIVFLSLFYFFSAQLKTGELWQNGSAIYYTLHEDLWIKNSTATILLGYPGFLIWLSKSVVLLEYGLSILLLIVLFRNKLRLFTIFVIFIFHTSIFIFYNVGIFPLLTSSVCILLLPSEVWNKIRRLNYEVQPPAQPTKHLILGEKIILYAAVFLIFWRMVISFNHYQNPIAEAVPMTGCSNSSLFNQYWAMYAPNPTTNPAYYKLVVSDESGALIDVFTEQSLISDCDQGRLEINKDYSNSVFFYRNVVYQNQHSPFFIQKWLEWNLKTWNQHHPGLTTSDIYLYVCSKNIGRDNVNYTQKYLRKYILED